LESTGIRPAFTPISLHAGPQPGNLKGVISPSAEGLFAMRIVPGQDPAHIGQMMSDHFIHNAPVGVTITAKISGLSDAWALKSFDSPAYLAASQSYEQVWGKKPVPDFCGGSIPVVPLLEQMIGVSPTLMGFGLESDGLHSPNEHFGIKRMQRGIETIYHFYDNFAAAYHTKNKTQPSV
jgi:acetylornithine deacetylase/succinyl-diaminopimelate desuccinylase-like protein